MLLSITVSVGWSSSLPEKSSNCESYSSSFSLSFSSDCSSTCSCFVDSSPLTEYMWSSKTISDTSSGNCTPASHDLVTSSSKLQASRHTRSVWVPKSRNFGINSDGSSTVRCSTDSSSWIRCWSSMFKESEGSGIGVGSSDLVDKATTRVSRLWRRSARFSLDRRGHFTGLWVNIVGEAHLPLAFSSTYKFHWALSADL